MTSMLDMSVSTTSTSGVVATFMNQQVWKCLQIPAHNNGLFKPVFFAEEVLADISAAAGLRFCKGLLEAVQSSTPPSIDFFKSLPDVEPTDKWCDYVLVLEKERLYTPLLYFGSGTAWVSRGRTYTKADPHDPIMPKYVSLALLDGYRITAQRALIWGNIPAVKNVPNLYVEYLLFVAVEVTLSFYFCYGHT